MAKAFFWISLLCAARFVYRPPSTEKQLRIIHNNFSFRRAVETLFILISDFSRLGADSCVFSIRALLFFQILLTVGDAEKLVVRSQHVFVKVFFSLFAFPINFSLSKKTGTVVVQIRRQIAAVQYIDFCYPKLRNMSISPYFSYHRSILTFHECIILCILIISYLHL